MDSRDISIVYMTCVSEAEARAIVSDLLEKRLVACANIMAPHQSLYWWQGQIQGGTEVAVIMKTKTALFADVRTAILSLHSYDCPCIVSWPLEQGHEPFLKWIGAETSAY